MVKDKTAPHAQLDIAQNRKEMKWNRYELLGRFVWEASSFLLFRCSPRQLWIWRRLVLRAFGARIGRHVHIHPSAKIKIPWNLVAEDFVAIGDCAIIYNLGVVTLGTSTTVSQNAHLCAGTHELESGVMRLVKKEIQISGQSWICADAFIGPGVTIGDRAVVGARSVVTKDVSPDTVVAGNPAQIVSKSKSSSGKEP